MRFTSIYAADRKRFDWSQTFFFLISLIAVRIPLVILFIFYDINTICQILKLYYFQLQLQSKISLLFYFFTTSKIPFSLSTSIVLKSFIIQYGRSFCFPDLFVLVSPLPIVALLMASKMLTQASIITFISGVTGRSALG